MEFFERFLIPHPSFLIYVAMVSIALTSIAIVAGVTYFKKWGYLWREWITTVDHKKIGIMYLLVALLMLFRGGVDAIMMRYQLAIYWFGRGDFEAGKDIMRVRLLMLHGECPGNSYPRSIRTYTR